MEYFGLKNLLNRRVMAVLLLAFSSGLPIVLTGSTLQAWYTVAGVNLMTIGALTLVGQPYIYKFLWAPLFDRFVPFRLGRRRSWILLMQILLGAGLAAMAFLNPAHTPILLACAALAVAFFSASQDIGIDAYRTDVLQAEERGMGAAVNTLGYRIAMLISGAFALIIAAKLGWRTMYLIMAAFMLLEIFVTFWAPNPQIEEHPPTTLTKAIVDPFKEFMSRPYAIAIMIFIVIYKISDAMALSLNTAFLIRGVGFSLIDIGAIAKTVSLVASLLGSLVGGIYLPRLGMYRSLLYFGFLQITSNLTFALLGAVGKNYWMMGTALFSEYFCGGLSTVAFVAFLMSLCDKRYTATQYALLSALAALGRIFIGPEAAYLVNHLGWIELYIWTFFLGIPGLVLLWWLQKNINLTELLYLERS